MQKGPAGWLPYRWLGPKDAGSHEIDFSVAGRGFGPAAAAEGLSLFNASTRYLSCCLTSIIKITLWPSPQLRSKWHRPISVQEKMGSPIHLFSSYRLNLQALITLMAFSSSSFRLRFIFLSLASLIIALLLLLEYQFSHRQFHFRAIVLYHKRSLSIFIASDQLDPGKGSISHSRRRSRG